MNNAKVRTSLIVLLLVSSVFFLSAQQAFALDNPVVAGPPQNVSPPGDSASDITIESGATLIIESGATLSFSGTMMIQSGGTLIIENGGTLELTGDKDSNAVAVLSGGHVDQFGTFVNSGTNPKTVGFVAKGGSWDFNCGATQILNGATTSGITVESPCDPMGVVLEIDDIPFGQSHTIDLSSFPAGTFGILEDDLLIEGTLINPSFLSNRALITVSNGAIDNNGGHIENVCDNYITQGITTIGSGVSSGGTSSIISCNPPEGNTDNYSTDEDTTLSIAASGVLLNDRSGDNDNVPGDDPTLSASFLSNPSSGSLDFKVDGSFVYIPNPGTFGLDSFTYTLEDGNGGTDSPVTVHVDVLPTTPTANPDTDNTDVEIPVIIDVLFNDTDPNNLALSVVSVTDPPNGSATQDGAFVTYTPDANFFGVETFSYTMQNTNGLQDSADVTVTVAEVNDPPVVSITSPLDNDVFIIGEPVDFAGTAIDEDGDISNTLNWLSSIDDQIGTGASFILDNLSLGVHNISTTATDSEGLEGSDSIIITIQSGELFCDDKTIAELLEDPNYNLIDNRGGPSSTLVGTNNADLILAGNFGDLVNAMQGNDCIIGGSGNDDLRGNGDNDEIYGGAGNDKIHGGTGHDKINGGAGNDEIEGVSGNDEIEGGAGNDEIKGGSGHDKINGGAGNDEIRGGSGNDTIDGGDGKNVCDGNSGSNSIVNCEVTKDDDDDDDDD